MRATEKQLRYLRILYNEAFAARFTIGYDIGKHLLRASKSEASKEIERLIKAKKNGWK